MCLLNKIVVVSVPGSQFNQLLRGVGGVDDAAFGDDHRVLDPASAQAGNVDAGLHRDHVAGHQYVCAAHAQPGLFMDEKAHAMAQTVAKGIGIAGINVVPGYPVDLPAGFSRAHRVEAQLLGDAHGLVNRPERVGNPAEAHGAGHVRAIAVHRRAEVQRQQLAVGDHVIRGRRVGQGAVQARGGDGIKADDSGYAYGYIGDKMSDAFFDFTVNSAESAQSYKDYTAAEGNKLVIVDITIHNTFRGSVPMFASDFYVVYDWNSDPVAYADPINNEDASLTFGDMLPNEYSLAINEEVNGLLVYEVPESSKDITLLFDEYFENEEFGDTYEVDFTVK